MKLLCKFSPHKHIRNFLCINKQKIKLRKKNDDAHGEKISKILKKGKERLLTDQYYFFYNT